MQVTMKGNPLNLHGEPPKVGQDAPDFTAMSTGLKPVKLSESKGKARLISAVPSLDTAVCSIQTKKFNDEIAKLGDDVEVFTISMDLPFAQNRFSEAEKIDKITMLSDYKDANFGKAYGLMIDDLRLLARAVVVVDKNDKISHVQVVPEIGNEPDYEAALDALKQAAK